MILLTSSSYLLKSHSRPNRILYDHLKSVALRSRESLNEVLPKITTSFSIPDLTRTAILIGATHDVGKGTSFFQDYLSDPKLVTNPLLKSHSMISSMYCSWIMLNDLQISDESRDFLALASAIVIQGHHGSLKRGTYYTGLSDFVTGEIFSKQIESFRSTGELEKISQNLSDDICHEAQDMDLVKLRSIIEFTNVWEDHFFRLQDLITDPPIHLTNSDPFEPYFTINLLYAILLDADRMDVAGLYHERLEEIDTESVRNYVNANYSQINENKSNNTINELRNRLFLNLDDKSRMENIDQRIFTLTADTGLGKTLSSVNFALNLRKRIKEKNGFAPRIIYVAPFISILDQNMNVLQKVFDNKLQSRLLLMHHHLAPVDFTKSVIEEQKKETYSTSQSELLIQGWNSEIIVTTFIQFFNSLFKRYTSHLRRLANMAGSIIILDEVQSIPFEYWGAVREVLLFLSKKFHFIVILMTATKPLIFKEDEAKEIVPLDISRSVPQRVIFHSRINRGIKLKEFCTEINELINKNKLKSVLVELNTIPTAIEVFNLLSTSDRRNKFFLSSQVIPKHRRPRIIQIKKELENHEPIVLVTTQVIEAGVDVDFDIGIRDIGPIDSIVQSAGRCNRNGNSTYPVPFYLYRVVDDNGNEFGNRVYSRVAIDIAKALIKPNSNLTELVNSYYSEVIRRRSAEKSSNINRAITELDYESVDKEFRLIDEEYKVPVFVEFDDTATKIWKAFVKLMEPLKKPSRGEIIKLRHQMEDYLISISEKNKDMADLKDTSGIYKINYNDIGKFYSEITGFNRV